ncbi:MAG TPA: FTR1 family protein [Rickettsiales bacterium]|nr:FTR1 family protein [Rickettsiales bacterium]
MLQILIVVFREIVEISLIVGILMAVTKKISRNKIYIYAGLFFGAAASIFLAFFTDKISQSFDGVGQEIFNGAILASAAIMISWTTIWMQQHARTLSSEYKDLSVSIEKGRKPLIALAIVVFLSTLREGAEIVLFTYSAFISGVALEKILIGFTSGALFGIIIGVALYFKMFKIFGKYFFKITTWILVFLACGITAQSFGFWLNADIIPAFGYEIWDSSNILSQTSLVGRFLHVFIGYIDRPSGVQLIAYLSNLTILIFGLKISEKNAKKNKNIRS